MLAGSVVADMQQEKESMQKYPGSEEPTQSVFTVSLQ